MNVFTCLEAGDSFSPDSIKLIKSKKFTRKLRLDSKGRISIPAEFRRNFGLENDSVISMVFSLDSNVALLVFVDDGMQKEGGDII